MPTGWEYVETGAYAYCKRCESFMCESLAIGIILDYGLCPCALDGHLDDGYFMVKKINYWRIRSDMGIGYLLKFTNDSRRKILSLQLALANAKEQNRL